MSADVITPKEFLAQLPTQMKRPCDYGLESSMRDLETQLGTIEAYNRLVAAARYFHAEIEAKRVKEPAPGTANPATE